MRRKKKDIDIYRILMLPLMTMFLLNIGLIATTWAWYTASISTGVNSIKAGVDVSVSVSPEASVNNGIYSLQSGNEYTFTFTLSCRRKLGKTMATTQDVSTGVPIFLENARMRCI